MKTAISIPDELFVSADVLAKRLGISRSELYATAVSEFVQRSCADKITERLNEVYATEDSSLDPVLAELQYRTLAKRVRREKTVICGGRTCRSQKVQGPATAVPC